MVGGTYTSPVLVVPEVAIGALGKTRRLPRFDENDNVIPVRIMEVGSHMAFKSLWGVADAGWEDKARLLLDSPLSLASASLSQVSWTADHRVIDGVTMASFSNVWKRYLENPTEMLMDLR